MDEIISGVQVIKMYAWEKPFMQLIALARRMELKVVRKSSYVRALYMTFAMFTTRLSLFCSMLAIVLLWGEEHITAAKVFVISSYLTVVAQNLTGFFIRGIAEIAESLVAFQRLQNFLENDEKVVLSIRSADTKQPEIITNANYIVQVKRFNFVKISAVFYICDCFQCREIWNKKIGIKVISPFRSIT